MMIIFKGLLLTLIVLISLIPIYALSQENTFGLGVAINNQSFRSIYLPYNTDNYIFETSINLSKLEIKNTNNSNRSRISTKLRLGLGIFKKIKNTKRTIIYYGTRIGLIEDNFKSESNSDLNLKELSGYFITPTMGFVYYLSRNMSFGVDLGLDIEKITKTNNKYVTGNTDFYYYDGERDVDISTQSNIIIRYDF